MENNMEKLLVPHTEEWFEALEALAPHQAIMTRRMLEIKGSLDICGICGDAPAHDYTEKDAPPNLPQRLCDDCLRIQTTMHRAVYSPVGQKK